MNCKYLRKLETPIYSCNVHNHILWEIVLQLTGTVDCKVGDKEYTMVPGDILIIPPYVYHEGKSEKGYTDICFCTYETGFKDVTLLRDKNDAVKNLMNMLHKTFIERDNNYNVICDSLANTIIQYIKSFSVSKEKYDFVSQMKEIIYENISNPDFKISEEIKKSGYNVDYFRRCFTEDVGKTPLEYLTELRINNAKNLLTQDYFSGVEDIAIKCGFSDQFYFSRKFKEYTGLSPVKYRKNAR